MIDFKDNYIDYPICKDHLINFLEKISEIKIIDEYLYNIYLGCIDCI